MDIKDLDKLNEKEVKELLVEFYNNTDNMVLIHPSSDNMLMSRHIANCRIILNKIKTN